MLEVLRAGFFTNIFCTNTVDNGESESITYMEQGAG